MKNHSPPLNCNPMNSLSNYTNFVKLTKGETYKSNFYPYLFFDDSWGRKLNRITRSICELSIRRIFLRSLFTRCKSREKFYLQEVKIEKNFTLTECYEVVIFKALWRTKVHLVSAAGELLHSLRNIFLLISGVNSKLRPAVVLYRCRKGRNPQKLQNFSSETSRAPWSATMRPGYPVEVYILSSEEKTSKGQSNKICWPVFWAARMFLGLNVNRLWFLNLSDAPLILNNYFKFWCVSGNLATKPAVLQYS